MDLNFRNELISALVTILILTIQTSNSYRVQSDQDAVAYLMQYGYVDPEEMPAQFTLKDCNKKLIEFQKFSRVEVTGVLDNATMKAMNLPRCGCPDFINFKMKTNSNEEHNHNHSKRNYYKNHKHHHHHSHINHGERYTSSSRNRTWSPMEYTLFGGQWNKRVVTYSIVKYPSRYGIRLTEREIEDAIQRAFQIWEQHINLQFRYQPNEIDTDIEISFVSTYHGDSYPFDGPGKTLAHAFFPGSGIGGDVHFEQEEDWRLGTYSGIDLLFVAVHEIGHSLGLGHSSVYGSIMYPMYGGYIPNLQLHQDDIRGIQAIYGQPVRTTTRRPTTTSKPRITTRRPTTTTTTKPTTTRTTTLKPFTTTKVTTQRPRPTTPKSGNEDLCIDPQIDAITTMLDDAIMVFKGTNVYEIGRNGSGTLPGWPKVISSYFRGLEGNLDCALTRTNGKTYFFKGRKYWRFTGQRMDRGYPKMISEYFPGIPNNLDGAFEWDGEFVFVKGDKFWRFNTRKRPQVQSFFPMPISHWGLNGSINAAFTAPDGKIYFFQKNYSRVFNKSSHKVERGSEGTTLSSEKWFGCWEP